METIPTKISDIIMDEDGVTIISDVICQDHVRTKFDSVVTMTAAPTQKYVSTMKSPATSGLSTTDYYIYMLKYPATKPITNLCGKKLTTGKRCQTENVGGCANTGCSEHYGWQDEVEGFRLRTF